MSSLVNKLGKEKQRERAKVSKIALNTVKIQLTSNFVLKPGGQFRA